MRRGSARVLVAAGVLGFLLAGASPGSAGLAVVRFPVFTAAPIFFATAGFSVFPVSVFGFSTVSRVIIQPVIIVRPTVFVAPTRVVVLSPIIPLSGSILPLAPMLAPAVHSVVDPPVGMPPVSVETVANIVRAPGLFDRRVLGVAGTVSHLEAFADSRGHPCMFFRLEEEQRSVSVLMGGQVNLRDGLPVQVTGAFFSSAGAPNGWPPNVIQALVVSGTP
jgi:hypothetical protein